MIGQIPLDLLRILLRDNPAVDAQLHEIGHDIGIDATLDQPDDQSRMINARDLGLSRDVSFTQGIERSQQAGRRLQRVDTCIGPRGVGRLALNLDLQM